MKLKKFFSKFKPQSEKVSPGVEIDVDYSGLKDFADEFRKRQNESFNRMSSGLSQKTQRISRFFYDNENDSLDVFDKIKAKASASGVSGDGSSAKFTAGAVICFIALASVIYSLLKIKSSDLFIPLILSALSLVCFLIFAFSAVSRIVSGGKFKAKFSVRVTVPDDERKKFFSEDIILIEEKIKEQTDTLSRLLDRPANSDEAVLTSLAEIYCSLYEMKVIGKYANVEGWVLPQCEMMLNDAGFQIVDKYTDEQAKMFSAVKAQVDRSFVLRPAVVRRKDGKVLQTGRFVKGGG